MKKATLPEENAASAQPNVTTTSRKGRRAISSLWYAVRTLTDAALTPDDQSILREAIDDILIALEGSPHG